MGYLLLTVLHLISNASLLRCVWFDYPNSARYGIMANSFARGEEVPTPEEVAGREPLLFGLGGHGRRVKVGGGEQGAGNWRAGLCMSPSGVVMSEGAVDGCLPVARAWFVALSVDAGRTFEEVRWCRRFPSPVEACFC